MRTRLIILFVCHCATSVVSAQPFQFTKVVDTNTVVPGTDSKFISFPAFYFPVVTAGRVTFTGNYRTQSATRTAIFDATPGGLQLVVGPGTPQPGTSGGFSNLPQGGPYVSTSGVATSFSGGGNGVSGIYRAAAGSISVVADTHTMVPDNSGRLFTFIAGESHTDGASTVMRGISGSVEGLYVKPSGGVLERVADTAITPPGGTRYQSFLRWQADGAVTYFTADGGPASNGLYRSVGGVASVVVRAGQGVPGTGGELTRVGEFSNQGDDFAFSATWTGSTGNSIFTLIDGQVRLVAASGQPAPGGGVFGLLGVPMIWNGTVVFLDYDRNIMYTNARNGLERVVGQGDTIDGRRISQFFQFGPGARYGNTVSFYFSTGGGSPYDAVYTVAVPGPHAAGLLGLAAAAAARRRRG
ncbi:MAG: hypothetical protein JNM07_12690 [Phycisphaerae bacterium]|nr:hypothetical protein [Phycisphaerae bacterium]